MRQGKGMKANAITAHGSPISEKFSEKDTGRGQRGVVCQLERRGMPARSCRPETKRRYLFFAACGTPSSALSVIQFAAGSIESGLQTQSSCRKAKDGKRDPRSRGETRLKPLQTARRAESSQTRVFLRVVLIVVLLFTLHFENSTKIVLVTCVSSFLAPSDNRPLTRKDPRKNSPILLDFSLNAIMPASTHTALSCAPLNSSVERASSS